MTNEKVAVPREVAEAIELAGRGRSNYYTFEQVKGAAVTPILLIIQRWAFKYEGGSPDLLMQALVNGYEVEDTPEDKVREYYESTRNQFGYMYGAYARAGIMQTLNILGIKIEGVNAL